MVSSMRGKRRYFNWERMLRADKKDEIKEDQAQTLNSGNPRSSPEES